MTDDTKEIVDQSENIKKYLKKVTGTMTELFDIVFYHEAQVGADFDNFEAIKSTRNETLEMALSDFKNICDQEKREKQIMIIHETEARFSLKA